MLRVHKFGLNRPVEAPADTHTHGPCRFIACDERQAGLQGNSAASYRTRRSSRCVPSGWASRRLRLKRPDRPACLWPAAEWYARAHLPSARDAAPHTHTHTRHTHGQRPPEHDHKRTRTSFMRRRARQLRHEGQLCGHNLRQPATDCKRQVSPQMGRSHSVAGPNRCSMLHKGSSRPYRRNAVGGCPTPGLRGWLGCGRKGAVHPKGATPLRYRDPTRLPMNDIADRYRGSLGHRCTIRTSAMSWEKPHMRQLPRQARADGCNTPKKSSGMPELRSALQEEFAWNCEKPARTQQMLHAGEGQAQRQESLMGTPDTERRQL